ncbi:O-antigen ligase family protein [Patescibacteria group bacterium]|nr:O-antigen ligase family protein [Patescibacteria group bacterium]
MFNISFLKSDYKKIFFIFLISFLMEMISFISFNFSFLNTLFFFLLVLLLAIFSFVDLKWGAYLLLAEIFLNSMGYIFYLENGGLKISLRIAFWLIFMAIFLSKFIFLFIKDRAAIINFFKNFAFGKNFLYLSVFLIFSFILGLVNNGFSDAFFDFNSWLFLILILPFSYLVYFSKQDEKDKFWKNIFLIFISVGFYMIFKSLFFLFLFSHDLRPTISDLYSWSRVYALGEITNMNNGFYRIFFQNQIFSFLIFYFSFIFLIKENKKIKFNFLLISILSLSVIVLSFSRSFWFGFLSVFLVLLFFIWHKYGFKKFLKTFFLGVLSLSLSLILIFIVVKFPWPIAKSSFNIDSFSERAKVTANESAISSRWALLDAMKVEIQSNFILGKGFGARIEYISSDPRVLQSSPDGKYSTYAFEWGWLDILLKMGVLGFAIYSWLILLFLKKNLITFYSSADYLYLIIISSLLSLSAVNFFTPYLNHPLGISLLILLILFFDYYKNQNNKICLK